MSQTLGVRENPGIGEIAGLLPGSAHSKVSWASSVREVTPTLAYTLRRW